MENSTNKAHMGNSNNSLMERAGAADQWSNHLPLLWLALEETGYGPVVEMGMGYGSTPFLLDYCKANPKHMLRSYDNNVDFFDKYAHANAILLQKWDDTITENVKVVLVDHSPGERRYIDALRYKDIKGIVVCHDTEEPPCGGNYEWEKAFSQFKYFARVKSPSRDGGKHNGVWATACSNHYDLTHWHGMTIGQYTIEP